MVGPFTDLGPPFDDAISAAFAHAHYQLITRRLVQGHGPVQVPEGREGNFVARDHNQRGQLGAADDGFTALCVAHSYGLMHYTEMRAFLARCDPFPGAALTALDVGCGVGSALMAVSAAARPDGRHRWFGYDPHVQTLGLAEQLLAGRLTPTATLAARLDDELARQVVAAAGHGQRLIITMSHVLGQQTLTSNAVHDLADWLGSVVIGAGGADYFGIEPDRSGVTERGPELLARLGHSLDLECHVDDVWELPRLETRTTAATAPHRGTGRKRVRWYTLRPRPR